MIYILMRCISEEDYIAIKQGDKEVVQVYYGLQDNAATDVKSLKKLIELVSLEGFDCPVDKQLVDFCEGKFHNRRIWVKVGTPAAQVLAAPDKYSIL